MSKCSMCIHSDGANQAIHKTCASVVNLELVLQLRSKLFAKPIERKKGRKHNLSQIFKMPAEDPCSRSSLRNKGWDLSSGNIESKTRGRNRLGLVLCNIFSCVQNVHQKKKSRKASCIGIHLCSKWPGQLTISHKGYLFQSMRVSPKPHCFYHII